jgi:hypothetical protein
MRKKRKTARKNEKKKQNKQAYVLQRMIYLLITMLKNLRLR